MSNNQKSEQSLQQPPQQSTPGGSQILHPTLVPELLGFSPQLLLDDIIGTASDAIIQCQQALEPFMQRWADDRIVRLKAEAVKKAKERQQHQKGKARATTEEIEDEIERDSLEAVEQGLVAFSTLLESHSDIAFDFFEAWSLRNIFAFPKDLPIVVPHQRGLELNARPEEETELMADIEELRRKIENQRRLRRMYLKAVHISRVGLSRSERNLKRLSYLSSSPNQNDVLDALSTLPSYVHELFENVTSLPHIEHTTIGAPLPPPDAGKRMWETNRAGYINWAVSELVAKSKANNPGPAPERNTAIGNIVENAAHVGGEGEVKALKSVIEIEGDDNDEEEDGDKMDTS